MNQKDEKQKHGRKNKKGCAIVIFIFIFLVTGLYFYSFHISNTIVIYNRTNLEIDSAALRVRARGVTYTAFREDNLPPRSRTRGSVEPFNPPRPEVNLSLYVQIHGEEHRIILSGYMSYMMASYGSFRVNIADEGSVAVVNVQFRRRSGSVFRAERRQRQIEIPLY